MLQKQADPADLNQIPMTFVYNSQALLLYVCRSDSEDHEELVTRERSPRGEILETHVLG